MRVDLVNHSNGLRHGAKSRTKSDFLCCHWQHEIGGVVHTIYMAPQYESDKKTIMRRVTPTQNTKIENTRERERESEMK